MRDVVTSNNHLSGTVTSHGAGVLFLRIPYSTGWTATVDSKPTPVIKANVACCGMQVSNGTHRIEMSYVSPGLRVGGALSGAGLLGLIALVGVAETSRRRRGDTRDESQTG